MHSYMIEEISSRCDIRRNKLSFLLTIQALELVSWANLSLFVFYPKSLANNGVSYKQKAVNESIFRKSFLDMFGLSL